MKEQAGSYYVCNGKFVYVRLNLEFTNNTGWNFLHIESNEEVIQTN